jgi:hypothetical protein
MSNPPRNSPCRCGSGKKYKKCCGSPGKSISPNPAPAEVTAQLPRGLPGMMSYIGVVPVFSPPSDPRNRGGPGGLPGRYEVILTLARPGFPLEPEGKVNSGGHLEGDSHLAIAKPAYSIALNDDVERVTIYSQTEDGRFELVGKPNRKGFLGTLTVLLDANSIDDARMKVTRAAASALSSISAQLDIPLWIYQTDVVELRTGNRSMSMVGPYNELPMQIAPTATLPQDFRVYTSFYREALHSNTPVFQFLCFFKIIEGLRVRRERLVQEALAAGKPPSRPLKEIIPSNKTEFVPWLLPLFHVNRDWNEMALRETFVPEALGQKISRLIDDPLRSLRHRVAHGALAGC